MRPQSIIVKKNLKSKRIKTSIQIETFICILHIAYIYQRFNTNLLTFLNNLLMS